MTSREREPWRNVAPIPRSQRDDLASSRRALGDFLAEQFATTFSLDVEEIMFETFPDGLYATMYIGGTDSTAHNVWAVSLSSALADAGIDVHVVVRPASDRLEAVGH